MSGDDRTPVMRRSDFDDPGPSRRSRSPSRRDEARDEGVRRAVKKQGNRSRSSDDEHYSRRTTERMRQEEASSMLHDHRRGSHTRGQGDDRESRDRRPSQDDPSDSHRDRYRKEPRDNRHHRTDSDSRRSRRRSRDRSRDRSRERSKHHRRRRKRSHSSDSSLSSGSSNEPEHHRPRRRRKEKERRKDKNMKTKTIASTSTWGKYGVINEANVTSKQTELRTWLIEERRLNPETLSKDRLRKETMVFIEDFNTASFPHEKFYDIEAYKIKTELIRTGQTLPLDLGSYDATADLKAHTSRVKAEKQKERKLSREEVEELRQIEKERVEIGRMRLLGMDVSRTLGVRTDYVKREEMVFDDKPFP